MKYTIQILLSLLILIISVTFYKTYFSKKKEITFVENKEVNFNQSNDALINLKQNLIENLKYEINLGSGRKYFITSDYSKILNTDNSEIISMKNVLAKIFENDLVILTIKSDDALYNNKNHYSEFSGDIRINYFNSKLNSNFMTMNFERNIIKIEDNVVYNGPNGSIETDNVAINLNNKMINMYMNNKNDNVKLIVE